MSCTRKSTPSAGASFLVAVCSAWPPSPCRRLRKAGMSSPPGTALRATGRMLPGGITSQQSPSFPADFNGGFTYDVIINGGSVTLETLDPPIGIQGLALSGGTVAVSSSLTAGGLSTFSGGTLGGSGTVTFQNLTWTGGNINGTGKVAVGPTGAMTISGTPVRRL